MSEESDIQTARQFGRDAFNNSKLRAPGFDSEFMDFARSSDTGYSILAAHWLYSWDAENLKEAA